MKIILLITNLLTGQNNLDMKRIEFETMGQCEEAILFLEQYSKNDKEIKFECVRLAEA